MLTTLDAWLARHFLGAGAAGYFTSATTAGRVPLFFPGALTTAAFPALAADRGRGRRARRKLGLMMVGVLAMSALAVLPLCAAPRLVMSSLFGAAFRPAASLLPIVAVADAAVGVSVACIWYLLARQSRWSLIGWGACVAAYGAAFTFHGTARALAWDMLAVNVLTLALLGLVVAVQLLADRRYERGVTPATEPSARSTRQLGAASSPAVVG